MCNQKKNINGKYLTADYVSLELQRIYCWSSVLFFEKSDSFEWNNEIFWCRRSVFHMIKRSYEAHRWEFSKIPHYHKLKGPFVDHPDVVICEFAKAGYVHKSTFFTLSGSRPWYGLFCHKNYLWHLAFLLKYKW